MDTSNMQQAGEPENGHQAKVAPRTLNEESAAAASTNGNPNVEAAQSERPESQGPTVATEMQKIAELGLPEVITEIASDIATMLSGARQQVALKIMDSLYELLSTSDGLVSEKGVRLSKTVHEASQQGDLSGMVPSEIQYRIFLLWRAGQLAQAVKDSAMPYLYNGEKLNDKHQTVRGQRLRIDSVDHPPLVHVLARDIAERLTRIKDIAGFQIMKAICDLGSITHPDSYGSRLATVAQVLTDAVDRGKLSPALSGRVYQRAKYLGLAVQLAKQGMAEFAKANPGMVDDVGVLLKARDMKLEAQKSERAPSTESLHELRVNERGVDL